MQFSPNFASVHILAFSDLSEGALPKAAGVISHRLRPFAGPFQVILSKKSKIAKVIQILLNDLPGFPTNSRAQSNSTKALIGPKADQANHRTHEALGAK
jgi:hypothetical protein